VHIGCAIRRPVWSYLIRIVVPATVRYCAISRREFWKAFPPHSIVLQTTVNKYYGRAVANFDVSNPYPLTGIRLISSAMVKVLTPETTKANVAVLVTFPIDIAPS
jgi:hypothetical protein